MNKYGLRAIEKASEAFGIPMQIGVMYRENYLLDRVIETAEHLEKYSKRLVGSDYETRKFIVLCMEKCKKSIKALKKEIGVMQHYQPIMEGALNPIMIERAREYPIASLIEHRKNMALCVNHLERNPSMNIKNNFAYCYSCGWHGDSIDVYMKLNDGVGFVEAVKALQ